MNLMNITYDVSLLFQQQKDAIPIFFIFLTSFTYQRKFWGLLNFSFIKKRFHFQITFLKLLKENGNLLIPIPTVGQGRVQNYIVHAALMLFP